jgi:Nucleoside 2-deoxyribosyltransferase
MPVTPRIYLAAPLFTDAEKLYNAQLRDRLCQEGYDTYLPQEQGEDARYREKKDDPSIFARHLQALDHTDLLIALCDGPDADSGTAWEAGYAYAKGIPVIALRTDNRTIGCDRRINLMLEQSSEVVQSIAELLHLLSHRLPAPR